MNRKNLKNILKSFENINNKIEKKNNKEYIAEQIAHSYSKNILKIIKNDYDKYRLYREAKRFWKSVEDITDYSLSRQEKKILYSRSKNIKKTSLLFLEKLEKMLEEYDYEMPIKRVRKKSLSF